MYTLESADRSVAKNKWPKMRPNTEKQMASVELIAHHTVIRKYAHSLCLGL